MESSHTNDASSRIRRNRYFASVLRKRLEGRHGAGPLRTMLNQLSDAELIEAYLANEARGREYTAERLAAKENRS
jgi:hypothetical protein